MTADVNGVVIELGLYGVTYVGDLTRDFKVNIQDITAFVDSYIEYWDTGFVVSVVVGCVGWWLISVC